MRWLTKSESLSLLVIFCVVGAITLYNLSISVRRARDVQRRADIGNIADALERFYADYGFFPPSEDGKIKICKASNFDEILDKVNSKDRFDRELFFEGLRACEWGKDAFVDVINNDEVYLSTLPSDPYTDKGYMYYILSNTRRFQLYSTLEGGDDEIGYDLGVIRRALPCGIKKCSYGKSYAAPIDRTIDDYETELQNQGKK